MLAVRRASSRLHQFLLGVLPSFSSLRSVILSQDPLPDVDRAFQMMCTEERLHGKGCVVSLEQEMAALAVRGPRLQSRGGLSRLERMKLFCSFCKKNGHERKSCFELTGNYPDWYYEKNKVNMNEGGSRGEGGTFSRGRSGGRMGGHGGRSGVPSGGRSAQANVANATFSPSPGEGSNSQITVYGVNDHFFSGKWLIDTGCSHHVTGNLDALSNLHTISNRTVSLPNGSRVSATQAGRVTLTNTIVLDVVLYVPQLTCNLISASQLSDALQCEFISNSKLCLLQDCRKRTVIGLGDRMAGF